jgi:hypothetical protein
MNFKEYLKQQNEETTSADIATVDSKLKEKCENCEKYEDECECEKED